MDSGWDVKHLIRLIVTSHIAVSALAGDAGRD
jgi:hypothetical protein